MLSFGSCMSLSFAALFPIGAKAEEHNPTTPQSDCNLNRAHDHPVSECAVSGGSVSGATGGNRCAPVRKANQ
jgi:hypothetical protein